MSRDLRAIEADFLTVSQIYADRLGITLDGDWALLKLQEELGELVQAHLRVTGRSRDKGEDAAKLREALSDEAADILGMLLIYCQTQNLDIEAAAARKWFKHLPEAVDG